MTAHRPTLNDASSVVLSDWLYDFQLLGITE